MKLQQVLSYVRRAIDDYQMIEDGDKIADYAKEAIEALYKTGVLNGSDGYYRPTDSATRAEAAVIIYNLFVK